MTIYETKMAAADPSESQAPPPVVPPSERTPIDVPLVETPADHFQESQQPRRRHRLLVAVMTLLAVLGLLTVLAGAVLATIGYLAEAPRRLPSTGLEAPPLPPPPEIIAEEIPEEIPVELAEGRFEAGEPVERLQATLVRLLEERELEPRDDVEKSLDEFWQEPANRSWLVNAEGEWVFDPQGPPVDYTIQWCASEEVIAVELRWLHRRATFELALVPEAKAQERPPVTASQSEDGTYATEGEGAAETEETGNSDGESTRQ